jgi:hypothetical protein
MYHGDDPPDHLVADDDRQVDLEGERALPEMDVGAAVRALLLLHRRPRADPMPVQPQVHVRADGRGALPARRLLRFITERKAQLAMLASSFGTLSGTRTRPESGST